MKHILWVISLLASIQTMRAGTVDTIEIFSISMQKAIKCVVILPDSYSVSNKPYPVLYLLHGWSGNYSGWLSDAPQIQQQADAYNMILVCPDGGYDSWYLDSPVDSMVRYETHITKEVVPFIDYYYHTRKDRAGRAIAGLSMGGHGAMYLAVRNPLLFGAAGSMCGGLDLRPWKKNDWDLKGILGDPKQHWANWEAASVVNLAKNFKDFGTQLIIDCGLGDFFLPVNQAMHQTLVAEGIPHEYTERPGEHNSDYWGNAIDYQLVFFHKFFSKK